MTSIATDPGARLRTDCDPHPRDLLIRDHDRHHGGRPRSAGRAAAPWMCCISQPYGYVGLFQAYFLMFLLALVCLVGATRWPSRLWNGVLLVAHLAPLLIIVIANDVFVSTGSQRMAYIVALTVHSSAGPAGNFRVCCGRRRFLRAAR